MAASAIDLLLSDGREPRAATNEDARKLFLTCGNFAQATYDAFDGTNGSPTVGQSLFTKEQLFSKVGLVDGSKYRIHSFLYANTGILALLENYLKREARGLDLVTHTSGASDWVGFVAYPTESELRSQKKLEIYVVLRGTQTLQEWVSNLETSMSPAKELLVPARTRGVVPDSFFSDSAAVHNGWLSLYTSITLNHGSLRQQIHDSVTDIVNHHTHLERPIVYVTGHSLGGALATISAYDLAVNKIGGDGVRVRCFAFSAPASGNAAFKKQMDEVKNLGTLHIYEDKDLVPQALQVKGYVMVHKYPVSLDIQKSRYIKKYSPLYSHNLEILLHLVAAYNFKDKSYNFNNVPRSLVLINKTSDAYDGAPANWWNDKNKKGLVFDTIAQVWRLPK